MPPPANLAQQTSAMPRTPESLAPAYEHRPKPFSNPLTLTFEGAVLKAERGTRQEVYALAEVEELRLSYTPKNTARLAFTCVLRMRDRRTLTFSSIDWRSLIETARQDAPYNAFVRALVQRVASANPNARLEAGIPRLRHTLFGAGAAGFALALAYVISALVSQRQWALAALALALIVWLSLYARDYWSRNRPQRFAADAIPPEVLPPAV